MILLECEQGSTEWLTARMGIPTASQASRIVTPGGKPSASQRKYIAELCAAWATGEPASEFGGTEWTERGKALEDEARRLFAVERDCEYQQIGLVYRDAGRDFAASPDGIVDGCIPLELKCGKPTTHLLYLSDGDVPREHVMQVQTQLWTMDAEAGFFMSHCPGLPPLIVEFRADPRIQDALSEHVPAFCAELVERKRRLIDLGVEPWGLPPGEEWRGGERPWWEDDDGEPPRTEPEPPPAPTPAAPSRQSADVDEWLAAYDAAEEG